MGLFWAHRGGWLELSRDVEAFGDKDSLRNTVCGGFKALVALGALGLGFRVVFLLGSMCACAVALAASFARTHVAPSAVVSFREFIWF